MSGLHVVIKFHFCNDFVNHMCVCITEIVCVQWGLP